MERPEQLLSAIAGVRLLPASRLVARQQAGDIAGGAAGRVPCGHPQLERLCGGGLPRGRLGELVVGEGGAAVLQRLLAAAGQQGRQLLALVDAADGFDIDSARASGVALDSLLWVRPHDWREALRCTELILAVRGFALVVLDLAGPAPAGQRRARPPLSSWARLRRAARDSSAALVVLSRRPQVGPFAAFSARLASVRPHWGGASGDSWLEGLSLEFEPIRRLPTP